ncbi:uncharacterized protein MONBRDRAFT_32622 [Monosiga brevicollis MX1]|uniref:J domain-containing protein n=1 Tax=Monosiga brevicollis TaxID=81824 RepID=A9V0R8_MONBE|nr:uncharacterized protein MONBRDRAFT_32622 [Monosiga brevicollis MX1]EDQ88801.1 predicted protein [Monosiga brevicollis MX1]|eukprot:XP_001746414.1 hypothetical protein [Monosiga brevicollis MX1]
MSRRAEELLNADTDNYYAVLNVPKEATADEIRAAFRRLCVFYHPDKHTKPEAQELASTLFPKIQRAYAVLSDPQTRAIYDLYGAAGVEAGHELAPYYNTVAELKAEYDMLQRKQEHERLLAMSAPRGSLTLNLDARDVFQADPDEDEGPLAYVTKHLACRQTPEPNAMLHLRLTDQHACSSLMNRVYISGMSIDQSVRTQLTSKDTLQLDGFLVSRDSRSGGTLISTWKRQWDQGWATESSLGVGDSRFVALKAQKTLEQGRCVSAAQRERNRERAKHCASSSCRDPSPWALSWPITISFAVFESSLRELHVRNRTAVAMSASATVYRSLAQHLYGLLQWQIGSDSAMKTAIVYDDQRIASRFEFKMGASDTAASTSVTYPLTDATKIKLSAMVGLNGFQVGYSLKHAITEHSALGLSLGCHSTDGIVVKAKFETMHQTYGLPIFLSDELMLEPIIYGTFFPIVGFFAAKHLIIDPWQRAQDRRKNEERRRRNRAAVQVRRQEALAAVQLMQETVERKIAAEESRGGLIIIQAWYGQLASDSSPAAQDSTVIDVTIPLQCLVKDSALQLHATSKASIVGFYDPCPEDAKQLRVLYRFRGALHEVTIDDLEELRMPLRSHARSRPAASASN